MDLIPHPHEIILGRQWSEATLQRLPCGHRVIDRREDGSCWRCEKAKAIRTRKRFRLAGEAHFP